MAQKSVMLEVREITLAIELIELGARLQLLEAETTLSRDRLTRLYKEVKGESPPKGMLPFSTDWFTTWQPNIHASLFYNIYRFMSQRGGCATIHSIVKAYRLYLEHVRLHLDEPVLSLTRAWTLVRFFDSGMLQTTPCTRCRGHFVAHAHDPHQGFVCGLCAPPSRAGKTRKAADAHGGGTQAAVGKLSAAAAEALPGGAEASA
ncbi:flagellar transcriptional regulator FlhC [Paraburkholderia diazotrophica]|uniref:Flagellar transcriptional regulator FlhC n=1 Tax=Paraburkholderia diazotrophica TaxID=667676 RepID=A0A1H7D7K5_9BURK|nr:flagellar transcriptional regulator FlhC [Paraburkholderia diazotrophica]SEJ94185.1 flagellar transcriptional activator FlhC [Paraburkholderia diazotrophica]